MSIQNVMNVIKFLIFLHKNIGVAIFGSTGVPWLASTILKPSKQALVYAEIIQDQLNEKLAKPYKRERNNESERESQAKRFLILICRL